MRLTLGRAQRLTHNREYEAVYAARMRKARGPLVLFTAPNELSHHRLGLAVGRRAGGAVVRNALKRRIREAFRHIRDELPAGPGGRGYDAVVQLRAHEPLAAGEYRALLTDLFLAAHRDHERRRARRETDA